MSSEPKRAHWWHILPIAAVITFQPVAAAVSDSKPVPPLPTIDRRVTDGLGITAPADPPLEMNLIGMGDGRGGAYLALELPNEGLMLGRREWTGRISYWLLVGSECNLERGLLEVQEGVARLRPEQADQEFRRIIAFFEAGDHRITALAGAPALARCLTTDRSGGG